MQGADIAGSEERLKDVVVIFQGNADAVILDLDD